MGYECNQSPHTNLSEGGLAKDFSSGTQPYFARPVIQVHE